MPGTFPLESSLFYLDLQAQYEPMVLRSRASDGSLFTVELADRVLWSMQGVRCRVTTATEVQEFEAFHDAAQ